MGLTALIRFIYPLWDSSGSETMFEAFCNPPSFRDSARPKPYVGGFDPAPIFQIPHVRDGTVNAGIMD
jgi:hypothetical protein